MIIQGAAGLPNTAQKSGNQNIGQGWLNELLVSEALPRYGALLQNGMLFTAANQSGSALSNLSSTCTGFCLINPLNSGKNLMLIDVVFAQTSTAATTANAGVQYAATTSPIGIASFTGQTNLTARSCLIGSAAATVATICSAVTLPATPVAVRTLWQPSVSASATTAIPPFVKDEIAGALGIAPGCSLSLSALSALSGITSMTWAEVPA